MNTISSPNTLTASTHRQSVLCVLLVLSVLMGRLDAAIIYSGVRNLAVPYNFDGLYVQVVSGATSTTEPGSWATAPWINPFFGGTQIASNDLLRPSVIAGTAGAEQIRNYTLGSAIDASLNYAPDYNGSTTHTGVALEQFQVTLAGLIGFKFQTTPSGPTYYGWLNLTVSDSGEGLIKDWAYNNTANEGIYAGQQLAVPEPGRAVLLMIGAFSLLVWRGRRRGTAGK
ncbi:MAG: PEP-CTERM sorting domain-containing protein [Verrucomicrobia bacterium]|nr:PEP-CTERM sorting domain-containing protein [Verrucomicrobiota bacterium]